MLLVATIRAVWNLRLASEAIIMCQKYEWTHSSVADPAGCQWVHVPPPQDMLRPYA